MNQDYYGLHARPFQLTPDPGFWFDMATHKKAMAYLGYGISQGEGFIVITGDPGTGKTILVGHLVETIDTERLNLITIVTTQIKVDDLLHMVAAGLGVETQGMARAQALGAIEQGLLDVARAGRRTLLIVDEVQALPLESLEELRMLSNFQLGGFPLLQIFLLGQPEFREALQGRERLEQLRQRVIAMHELVPMAPDEVQAYLMHRLSVAGSSGSPTFDDDAVAAIHRWSRGVPREVNLLAARLMMLGAMEELDVFTGAHVEQVIADLERDTAPATEPKASPTRAPDPDNSELLDRIARMEARLEEQDRVLRRVLALLVEWVEGDRDRPDPEKVEALTGEQE